MRKWREVQIGDPINLQDSSLSNVSWVSSTLTTSSKQSDGQLDDDGIWCAQKMRKQRYKMQKLLICYEQQSKCISQLEEYIDELQKNNSMKDQEINKIKISKYMEQQVLSIDNLLQKELAKDQELQRHRMLSIINEKVKCYDLERIRWQNQLQTKQIELEEQRQSHLEQIQNLKLQFQDKIIQKELKFRNIQENLTSKISKLQKQNNNLKQNLSEMSQKLSNINEFKQMIDLRRQLSKRQVLINNNISIKQKQIKILSQQIEKYRQQIKKIKKENCILRNQLQTKQFDYDVDRKVSISLQVNKQKSLKVLLDQKVKSQEKLMQELKKIKHQLYQNKIKYRTLENKHALLETQILTLKNQYLCKMQKAKKMQSLRDLQHQQIQNMNKLFKKIDIF